MLIEVRTIIFNSKEYELEVNLRNKVLREPLGLMLLEEELRKEINQYHVGAFVNESLVGCLVLMPLNKEIIRMRQVAVDSEFQGLGIGQKLVLFSEDFSIKNGFRVIQLNARLSAIPFYLKQGYMLEEGIFNEITIPHQKMKKTLVC